MNQNPTCPRCGGAQTKEGLCPRCEMAVALNFESIATKLSDSVPSAETNPQPAAPISPPAFGHPLPSDGRGAEGEGTPFGDYELLEEIARGGMGIVYKARQRSLNRLVALKMILAGQFAGKQAAQRFRGEAAAAGVLQHPNIVAIHEIGMHDGQHFFSMDFVEGQNLSQLVGNRPLPAHHAARYAKLIAEAIHYAHQQGILHRDLKPSNVLIDAASDQPRVTDFGLAKRLDGESSITMTGQVLGSPNFMPPEQASGTRGKVGRHSDVYGLGGILYFLLTARPPFQGETLEATIHAALHVEPIAPRLLNASVPRDLETICLRCLEKEPAKRYASAQELADELGRLLRDEPIHARPVNAPEKVWRWCRRKPALAASLAAVSALLFIIGVGSPVALVRINEARRHAETRELDARRAQYASDMNLAHQAVNEGDFFRALQLLERHRPAARSGELAFAADSVRATQAARFTNSTDAAREISGVRQNAATPDLRGWEWRYLWQQCRGEERFILGQHTNDATAVGILPDGKTVFSAGADKTVRLWNLDSRQPIAVLPHDERVIGAAASPDGRWLATATQKLDQRDECSLQLWDIATRRVAAILTTNYWLRPTLVFSPNSKYVAFVNQTPNGSVHLWDVTARKEIASFPTYFPYLGPLGVAFSPDNRTLAYNRDYSGDICLWDVVARKEAGHLSGHSDLLQALAFAPDGGTLASGCADGNIRLWDMSDGHTKLILTNHRGSVICLAFSPDGKTLASSSGSEQTVKLTEVETGVPLGEFRGHTKPVTSLAFTADGHTLITSSGDSTMRVWDVPPHPDDTSARKLPNDLSQWTSGNFSAAFLSPDGRHLLTAFSDGGFSLWDVATFSESSRYPQPLTNSITAAVTSGGQLAAFATFDGSLALWDRQTGRTRWLMETKMAMVHRLAFSPDGQQLAIAGDKSIRLLDVADGKEAVTFSAGGEFAFGLTFSNDGKKLLAGFEFGAVRVWDLTARREIATLRGHSDQVHGLALLPDGQTLVSGAQDVRLWDVASARQKLALSPRPTGYWACTVSPDGGRLAVGAGDGLITIWDLVSLQEVATLKGHTKGIIRIAFQPDGDTIVSVSRDQLLVWRTPSFKQTDDPAPTTNR
ncbi:MAG: protein kinase [Verrucomicrobia bacterium]|nr:protein kinase [Verrucomicrobiota bacterium]